MSRARDNGNNYAGDITGITAGTGLTGGGTSGNVTLTNQLATIIDAAGDLIYGTGADAVTRLAIGTAGQVLTVNSGATAPGWVTPTSGGMTLLTSGTLTVGASGVTFSFTTTGYNEIWVYVRNAKLLDTNRSISIRPNSNATANNYRGLWQGWNGTTLTEGGLNTTETTLSLNGGSLTAWEDNFHSTIRISNLYDATHNPNGWVLFDVHTAHRNFGGEGAVWRTSAFWKNNTALTSIFFNPVATTFNGGRVEVWGIK